MGAPNVEVLVLNKTEIEKLITYEDVIEAVEIAFKAQATKDQLSQPPSTPLFADPPNNTKLLLSMPCCIKSIGVAGIKWTNAYYQNQRSGTPPMWGGVIVLNDPETGIPYSIIEATAITHMRTAGGHAAVAAKYLAKKDSRMMAIIGCGAEARTGLLAFHRLFPLETAKIFDIEPEAMSVFQREISSQISVKIIPTKTAEEAFEGADIIMLATSANRPILMEQMVPIGCFVAGLRRFIDIDPVLSLKADKWVLGNRVADGNLNIPDIGLSYNYVYADMGEIITGAKPGRENYEERILYTHTGMGAHDVALSHIAYKKAREQRMGTEVRLI